MVRANKYLSECDLNKAIGHYTKILYSLSDGHVCALLNRSLAYLLGGYPELAVVDAYRASIIANEARSDCPLTDNRIKAASKYLRTERLHQDADDEWTTAQYRFIAESGWARSPLSSIVINDTPELENPNSVKFAPFRVDKRQPMCIGLEERALYRLCGALYMCGDGARQDALGMIDDTTNAYRLEIWEHVFFNRFGNEILRESIEPEFDKAPSTARTSLSLKVPSERDQEAYIAKIKDTMKKKTAMIKAEIYPWGESWEPELPHHKYKQLLKLMVKMCTTTCFPHVVTSADILDDTFKPYVELRAKQDIRHGELVLLERTVSHVTTSSPEDLFMKAQEKTSKDSQVNKYYCDTCSTLLVVPKDCPIKYEKSGLFREKSSSSSLPSSPMYPSEKAARGSESPELDDKLSSPHPEQSTSPTSVSQISDSKPPDPPPHAHEPASFALRDFMFCCGDHRIPTCSESCRKARETFDHGLCHSKIEHNLRKTHRLDTSGRLVDERRTQCLVDLLFLRTLAIAFKRNKNPLHVDNIIFATSGINDNETDEGDTKPWSYRANVVAPLDYLHQLCDNLSTDRFANLDKTDGWLIHTLMSKISKAMRITKGPKYVKIFDDEGVLESAFGPSDPRWDKIVESEDKDTWIGSINPVFNMIRIADTTIGEVPNVTVVYKEGIECYAVGEHGKVAIQAGEVLLRAPDDQEGLGDTGCAMSNAMDDYEEDSTEEPDSYDNTGLLDDVSQDLEIFEDPSHLGDEMETDG